MRVVVGADAARRLSGTAYPVRLQHTPRGGIDAVAKLLGRGRGGGDLECGLHPGLFDDVLHYEFRSRTAADVAVANE